MITIILSFSFCLSSDGSCRALGHFLSSISSRESLCHETRFLSLLAYAIVTPASFSVNGAVKSTFPHWIAWMRAWLTGLVRLSRSNWHLFKREISTRLPRYKVVTRPFGLEMWQAWPPHKKTTRKSDELISSLEPMCTCRRNSSD